MTETLLSVDEARARILAALSPLSQETVPVADAGGRVLAEALHSRRDLPAFDNSAMDGVGVRVADVASASPSSPVRLALSGSSLAGAAPPGEGAGGLAAGSAARIMTGAPVPAGVEAVVMREQTSEAEVAAGFVSVLAPAAPGQNVRRRGEDVRAGDVVGRPGDVVTPARLNLLLAAGLTSARAVRRPSVAVLASGDELVEVGEPLGPGDVVNSNAHAVAAAARTAGCDAHLLGIARDTLEDHVRMLEGASRFDVVLTIGGVSMGTHDFVRPALERLGVTLDLWRVAMKPGKPVAFGAFPDGRVVFGLPGNPVSAMVSFELFVRPALARLQGRAATVRPLWPAILVDSDVKKRPGLEHWARGSARLVDGKLHVRVLEGQGSHRISVLARANALVRFPRDGAGGVAGDAVDVLLLDDPLTAADLT